MNGAFTFNVGNTSGSPKTRGPAGSNPRRHRSPAVTGFIPSSSAPAPTPALGNNPAQPFPAFGSAFGPATGAGPAPAFGPATGFGLATDPAQPSSGFGPAGFGNSPAQPSLGLNGPATGPPPAFGNSHGLNGQGKPPRPRRYVKAARPTAGFPTNQGAATLPNKAAPSLSINIKPAPADNAKRGVDDMMEGVTGQPGQAQIIGEKLKVVQDKIERAKRSKLTHQIKIQSHQEEIVVEQGAITVLDASILQYQEEAKQLSVEFDKENEYISTVDRVQQQPTKKLKGCCLEGASVAASKSNSKEC